MTKHIGLIILVGWSTASCDPKMSTDCLEGEVRETQTTCGEEDAHVFVDTCQNGLWDKKSLCLAPQGEYEQLNFGAGYFPGEYDYDQAAHPAQGVYGWSYYLRAFDLVRDTPVREIGWGQWSKPSMPADGLEVCGVHPHGFVCDEDSTYELEAELKDCGHTDWQKLEDCQVWCCSEEDKCGVRGSIEGGMGYWMYTIDTPHVKWMLPGATNANYEIFGGTFGAESPKPCTQLGGAVRVANNLLVPNDFVSFEGDTIDGFLGYMLTRSPIGKRSSEDNANHWTIVIDTENFAGPVMVMASWFWDSRINWHPQSVSWSDPRALIGYIAQGFEGRVGAIGAVDSEGVEWRRTNRWAFPQDVDENGEWLHSSTLFTGHSQYNTDWAMGAMEPMLAGTGSAAEQSPGGILSAAMAQRSPPNEGCTTPSEESDLEIEMDDVEDVYWEGFGVGGSPDNEEVAAAQAQSASCHMKLELNPELLDCDSQPGWCEGTRYLKRAESSPPETPALSEVPERVKAALNLRTFEPLRRNDGRYLGPPQPSEEACFDAPGPAPADPRLYCTRTASGNWIGFRWYRFIDQPEMNQVFASLPESEQDGSRCYMQARIERLHQAQQANQEQVPRWFDAPQGAAQLPDTKVSIESALLITPPEGLEVGFVPVPVYERKRVKPENCEVVLGETQSEPAPLPDGFYSDDVWDAGDYEPETCPANEESGESFSYPGTIFPYPPKADATDRTPYVVPMRSEVGERLPGEPIRCGLISDPP